MKVNILCLKALVVWVVVMASSASGQGASDPQPTPRLVTTPAAKLEVNVRGDGYYGYISPCSGKDGSVSECWVPTTKDVARLEKGLSKYVLSSVKIKDLSTLLPQYHRTYRGIYKKSKITISVLLRRDPGHSKKESPIAGEAKMPTFSLNFDVETGKYSNFREVNYYDSSALDTI
jgi:hypothetical protein